MRWVMRLSIDHWKGMTYTNEEIESPRWIDVDAFVRRLDQDTHTNVSLEGPEIGALMIGGGRGDYVVLWMKDGDNFLSLKTEARGGPTKLITVGGQPGDYDSELVVTLDQALAVARYWFENSKLDPSLKWEP